MDQLVTVDSEPIELPSEQPKCMQFAFLKFQNVNLHVGGLVFFCCFSRFQGFQCDDQRNSIVCSASRALVDSLPNAYNRSKNLAKVATKKLASNLSAQPGTPFEDFGGHRIKNSGFRRPLTFPGYGKPEGQANRRPPSAIDRESQFPLFVFLKRFQRN